MENDVSRETFPENVSEVARMRWLIARENESTERMLKGFKRGAAMHAFLTSRTERFAERVFTLSTMQSSDEMKVVLNSLGGDPPLSKEEK